MRDEPNTWRDLAGIAVIVGLFAAIALVPPDTSLSEIRKEGTLRVCVPPTYGNLVTGDPAAPGFEVEIMQIVADRLGVRLALNVNPAIGQDFNPRAWRLTRAQCQIVAGGVVATDTTRSFLDTTPPHLETGWVLLAPGEVPASLAGARVGVHAGVTGRDRLALSRTLREAGAEIALVDRPAALEEGIGNGTFAAGVTEALAGGAIAAANGWQIAWLLGPESRDPVAFGLWKGDMTLKRRVVAILDDLQSDGTLARLAEKYGIVPIEATFGAPEGEPAA
jgi:polar amino acid transport system substrate-binding protein/cystine transport system substrate-binding protein/membrane-bound lytic murein transglycosylase F